MIRRPDARRKPGPRVPAALLPALLAGSDCASQSRCERCSTPTASGRRWPRPRRSETAQLGARPRPGDVLGSARGFPPRHLSLGTPAGAPFPAQPSLDITRGSVDHPGTSSAFPRALGWRDGQGGIRRTSPGGNPDGADDICSPEHFRGWDARNRF